MASVSIEKFTRKKFKTLAIKGGFEDLIGLPECAGSMIIYGLGGNGKTTFALQLVKHFATLKKIGYNSIEEKVKYSFQQAVRRANLLSVNSKVKIWVSLTVEELKEELLKPKSPEIVFIDSVQYLRTSEKSINELTKFEYKDLINSFPNKLFVFISHAKNGEPKGSLAQSIYYDADTCIEVIDFVAYPKKSRYGGNKPFEISQEFN